MEQPQFTDEQLGIDEATMAGELAVTGGLRYLKSHLDLLRQERTALRLAVGRSEEAGQ